MTPAPLGAACHPAYGEHSIAAHEPLVSPSTGRAVFNRSRPRTIRALTDHAATTRRRPYARPTPTRSLRLLFLSQRVPYPPNRGDKITTWRLLERMARQHQVTVVAFAHDDSDREAAARLNEMGYETVAIDHHPTRSRIRSLPLLATQRPLTLGVYGSRDLQRAVDERVEQANAAYAYSSSMGAFLLPHSLPWVMHFAELDSDKWRQYSEQKSFPASWVYRREWRTLLAFERRIAESAVQNVFCTPLEQDIFEREIPGPASSVLRNGVDLEYFQPATDQARAGELVFTGVMNYYPNVDAATFFTHEVLPRVREVHPEAHFTIVGAHPSPEVERLREVAGVEVTGFVDDTRDYLRRASVAVAPLRIARGIQNKVLEAMAMGLPIVGTTSATQGVGAEPGRDYLVANDAAQQAQAVIELLNDRTRAQKLGRAARDYVERHYDWEVVFEPLDRILDEIAKQTKP